MPAAKADVQAALGIAPEALPRHVAIIMDGNGRWARTRQLPRIEGHRNAGVAVRETIKHCSDLGIRCLTLYSFSMENWKRPAGEVGGLMSLYAQYLVSERDDIMRHQIRVVHVGRRDGLPRDVLDRLDETVEMSRQNAGMALCIALNYGSRAEMIDAMRALARRVAAGELSPEQIDEQRFSDALNTAGLPDPDLVIRTAGEMRLSNFLLWQISYAELYVTDVLWPDFRKEHLDTAFRAFAARERRFGDVRALPPTA